MTTPPASRELPRALQGSWLRFLDVYEPLRPDLYRYCRNLTASPWDADDLVQDTMARAFATLGCMHDSPPNPRAWLFRVASNLWIDRVRRLGKERHLQPEPVTSSEPRATREAAGTLIARLSPQERAAVVLKDAFDLTLEEIAEVLSTTVGAVKAALHGGRGKLVEPPESEPPAPARAVLDAFCDAFNAGDLPRLTSLLLDTAEIEVVRVHTEYGPEAARKGVFQGMLFGSRILAEADKRGGIDPRYMQGALPSLPRVEARTHRGEPILLHWYAHTDGEFVRAITRVETEGDRLSRVRNYFYTPDVIEEICRELGVPFRVNGYRYYQHVERSH